jgi:2-polyprenyl-3-methyl-5-hydroxy-6-metoxy-1,4-benzoquinol methylase
MTYICNFCGNIRYKEKIELTKRIGANNSKFRVVRCTRCSLHSLFPLPTNREIKEIYSNYIVKGDRELVENKRQLNVYPHKISIIKQHYPNVKTVLEIGAGMGGFINVALKRGIEKIIGIEMDKEQVRIAKEVYNIDLVNSTFEDYILLNNELFDAVHMHHVLEHFKDPKNILNSIYKLLKPGGVLIFEVPNQFFVFPKEFYFRLGYIKYPKPYNPFHHLYFFSPKIIKKLALASNYEILELNCRNKLVSLSPSKVLKQLIANLLSLATSDVIEVVCRKPYSSFNRLFS